MNVKKLRKLCYLLEHYVSDEQYNQDSRQLRSSLKNPGVLCGCAMAHWENKVNYFTSAYTFFDIKDSLENDMHNYVFSSSNNLRQVAKNKNWPSYPESSERESTIKRIEFLLNNYGKN